MQRMGCVCAEKGKAIDKQLELSLKTSFLIVILNYCASVVQVLAESDQLRKEADDLGPRAELDHWKRRMSRFNYLLDQLKSPDVKAVLGVLLMAKSKLIKVRKPC